MTEFKESHKQRLINLGLFKPLTMREVQERSYTLQRIEQGEKIAYQPCYCVYRSDGPFNHVMLPPGRDRCEKAELICSHLYNYEAHRICEDLCRLDPEQPPRPMPGLPPLGMYKICTEMDWKDWEESVNQLRLDI